MIATGELKDKWGIELTALVLACKVFLGTAQEEELAVFFEQHTIDMPLLVRIAAAHHIRPILNRAVANIKSDDAARQQLQADCRGIALKNFEQYKEFLRLNSLFVQKRISVVPYKGSSYCLQFYGDLSLRESSDLDFLMQVSMEDLEALERLFKEQGYANLSEVPANFKVYYFEHVREFKFAKFEGEQRKFLAEFHVSLNDAVFETTKPIQNAYLFADLQQQDTNGQMIKALSPTKHVIAMLSHHGVKEQWTSLKNLVDIAMAIKNGTDVEWNTIADAGHKYGFNGVLGIGLGMINDLLGVMPPIVIETKQGTGPWMNKLFARHNYTTDRSWMYNFYLKLNSKDSAGDKARALLNHVLYIGKPSILDYKFIALPKPLFFLYVLVKPIRKLVKRNN
jgi:hypothetical protein